MADNILVMDHITKEFPGVKALDNVNLEVQRGEIHALIGENGAGKSTLMNVLSGQYPYGSYTGTVTYEGEECKFKNLNDSEAKGIVIIHQELALIPLLSIGENMFLGNEIKNKSGSIDWDRTYSEAEKHMAQVGLHESAQTLIKDIGTGKQQLVEIAKAFSKKVKLLILDEPTSSLNDEDAKMLLDLLMEFKKNGLTSIIITHKLNEIIYCADRCTIIRDGTTIETLTKGVDDLSEDRIIKGMVGRSMDDRYPVRKHNISKDVMMEAIENSLLSACKNHFGTSDNIKIVMDRNTCDYSVYAEREVVEEVFDPAIEISLEDAEKINPALHIGDIAQVELHSKEFGRIATQNAKNVILQKIREEERKVLFDQYHGNEKEVVTGIVQRVNAIANLFVFYRVNIFDRTGQNMIQLIELTGIDRSIQDARKVPSRCGKVCNKNSIAVRVCVIMRTGVQIFLTVFHIRRKPGAVYRLNFIAVVCRMNTRSHSVQLRNGNFFIRRICGCTRTIYQAKVIS